jgi:hypothetical protein
MVVIMAHYLVTANPKKDHLDDLKRNLKDKAFISLKPFGRALTYSLEHVRIREDGYAVWEEEDYCRPPLKEERRAVLDKYFEEIQVEEVSEGEGWRQITELPELFPDLLKD